MLHSAPISNRDLAYQIAAMAPYNPPGGVERDGVFVVGAFKLHVRKLEEIDLRLRGTGRDWRGVWATQDCAEVGPELEATLRARLRDGRSCALPKWAQHILRQALPKP